MRLFLNIYAPIIFDPIPSDGFLQRVNRMDQLFEKYGSRTYIHNQYRHGKHVEFEKIGPNKYSLAINYSSILQKFVLFAASLLSGRIYFHSLYTVYPRILKVPFIKVFFEPHGIVPEEEKMRGNDEAAARYEIIERQVMQCANVCVVVSGAMRQHFQQKYPEAKKVRYITFPTDGLSCTPPTEEEILQKSSQLAKPVVVYAGGLQTWQLIPEMQDLISHTANRFTYQVFVPNPSEFVDLWGNRANLHLITVESKTRPELFESYKHAHFGLVLRDDHQVNRVACPTKILDYLSSGVVPLVKFAGIGDFDRLGFAYISVRDIAEGKIPDSTTWATMVRQNMDVARKIQQQLDQGRTELLNEMIKH